MALTDKNRKILWARSGNRCAVCRISLVVERTSYDSESVVGEECHIVSAAPNGPRHDPFFSTEQIDTPDNLILLCANDHKKIDDQSENYTTVIVRKIKADHEAWVEDRLNENLSTPIRRRRLRQNIPQQLSRITSGKLLLDMAATCSAHCFDYENDLSEEDVELVGGFGQEFSDFMDIVPELEPLQRARSGTHIQKLIGELELKGFLLFGAVEVQRLEGGVSAPSDFKVIHLFVSRTSNPAVQDPPTTNGD